MKKRPGLAHFLKKYFVLTNASEISDQIRPFPAFFKAFKISLSSGIQTHNLALFKFWGEAITTAPLSKHGDFCTCHIELEWLPRFAGPVHGQAEEGAGIGGSCLEQREAEQVSTPEKRDPVSGVRHQVVTPEPSNV